MFSKREANKEQSPKEKAQKLVLVGTNLFNIKKYTLANEAAEKAIALDNTCVEAYALSIKCKEALKEESTTTKELPVAEAKHLINISKTELAAQAEELKGNYINAIVLYHKITTEISHPAPPILYIHLYYQIVCCREKIFEKEQTEDNSFQLIKSYILFLMLYKNLYRNNSINHQEAEPYVSKIQATINNFKKETYKTTDEYLKLAEKSLENEEYENAYLHCTLAVMLSKLENYRPFWLRSKASIGMNDLKNALTDIQFILNNFKLNGMFRSIILQTKEDIFKKIKETETFKTVPSLIPAQTKVKESSNRKARKKRAIAKRKKANAQAEIAQTPEESPGEVKSSSPKISPASSAASAATTATPPSGAASSTATTTPASDMRFLTDVTPMSPSLLPVAALDVKEAKYVFPKKEYVREQISCINILLPSRVTAVIHKTSQDGKKTVLKGGAVRDSILNRLHGTTLAIRDYDLYTTQTHKNALDLTRELSKQFDMIREDFPYSFAGNLQFFRFIKNNAKPIDVITNGANPDHLPENQTDFTINNVLYDVAEEAFIIHDEDTTLHDLYHRQIRTSRIDGTFNPVLSFTQDPSKMLRAIQLKTHIPGATLEQKTLEALCECNHLLSYNSKNNHSFFKKLNSQINKMIYSGNAYNNFYLMWELGVLEEMFSSFNTKLLFDLMHEIDRLINRKPSYNPPLLKPIVFFLIMISKNYAAAITNEQHEQVRITVQKEISNNRFFTAEFPAAKSNSTYYNDALYNAINIFNTYQLTKRIGFPDSPLLSLAPGRFFCSIASASEAKPDNNFRTNAARRR